MIIYKVTNKINGKVYIGQTKKTLKERRLDHLSHKKSKKYYFHNALIKYGYKNFEWEIIDNANRREELNQKEIYWIEFYNSTNKIFGYNCTEGGRVPIFNEETRKKISKAGIGRKISEETRIKLRNIHKGKSIRPKSYIYTEKHKRKISKANKGRKHPPMTNEIRKKMSDARKGKMPHPVTERMRQRASETSKGRIPWNKGKTGIFTKETLEKMSESSKSYKPTEETKRKISNTLKGRISPMKGKLMHPNTKKGLLKALTGRIFTEETKKKIGDAQRGEKNHNYGKKISLETAKKRSISIRKAVERKRQLGIPWKIKSSKYQEVMG